jgi:type IV pilus biogenesis protein CpaD/CtpE
MNMHPFPMVVAILLALAACRPGPAEFTKSEAPNRLRLDDASVRVDLRFAAGSAHLLPGDAEKLRVMAASGVIAPSDRVQVAAGGRPGLAQARLETVASELLRYGIVVTALPLAGTPANLAIVEVGRYMVTLPPCPNWSKDPADPFTNSVGSNFGCANTSNFGRMAASPADLVSGRPRGSTAGQPAVAAVNRYLADRVELPSLTTVGPIGGAASAATGGAGGGGGSTSGSQ